MRIDRMFSSLPWHKRSGIPLAFRPTLLVKYEYIQEVCQHMLAKVEGLSELQLFFIENKKDRRTYQMTVEKCLELCKQNPCNPDRMLTDLQSLKDNLKNDTSSSWNSNPLWFKELAVTHAMELISSTNVKYLVHD